MLEFRYETKQLLMENSLSFNGESGLIKSVWGKTHMQIAQ